MQSSSSSLVGPGDASVSERSTSSDASPVTTPTSPPHSATKPASDTSMKTPAIEPLNPFDQVTAKAAVVPPSPRTAAAAPAASADLSSSSDHRLVVQTDMLNPPPSPDRSYASSGQRSVPASPMDAAKTSAAGVLPVPKSAPTTPLAKGNKHKPAHPQSAPHLPTTNMAYVETRAQTEQRVQYTARTSSAQQGTIPPQPVFDDDENTEPSSQAENAPPEANVAGSFVRFLENTRRRLGNTSTLDGRQHALSDDAMDDGTLICGYLQKLGRNGKWQTRWFETDGECLSYYKSNKRSKLLATLDLEKVGLIELDSGDMKGCSFTIQVLGRLYHLRADTRASCKDWVITLNRIKEARLQQGHVKLVSPDFQQQPVDLLDQRNEELVTPRVVVVANRQRTRAVDESQEWDQLIMLDGSNNPEQTAASPYDAHKRRSTISTVVLARWTKRRSTFNRIGAKLAKWARSLRKYRCSDIEEDSVQLDQHVHPPGHDYKGKVKGNPKALSGWIGKEKAQTGGSADSDDINESPGPEAEPAKPAVKSIRSYSTASDDGARFIS